MPQGATGRKHGVNTPLLNLLACAKFCCYAKSVRGMRVLLRHAGIGLYYVGRKHWVGDLGSATDLGTIERAAEVSREESFEEMDVVVTYDDATCELVLPLRRNKETEAATLSAGG